MCIHAQVAKVARERVRKSSTNLDERVRDMFLHAQAAKEALEERERARLR